MTACRSASSSAPQCVPLLMTFRAYRLEAVYLRSSDVQREEIVRFWREQRAVLHPQEAARRRRQVVLLVRNCAGELVGLSSVGVARLPDEARPYYAYRMFLRQQDRVPYLMRTVTNATRDFLQDFNHPQLRPAGMLMVTENRKLMRAGIRRYFARQGYRYRGQTRQGLDVWVVEFTQTLPVPAGAAIQTGHAVTL